MDKLHKEKILFVYPLFSSFVRADYEMLSEKYDVIKYHYIHKKSIVSHLINQIKLKFWLLKNIMDVKAIYIWFADYHSFLPVLFAKVFNKKSFLVLGGYDVTYIPELNYGSQNKLIRKFVTLWSIKNATSNLAVSKFVLAQARKLVNIANIHLLYNGIKLQEYIDSSNIKENIILTVGVIDSEQRIKIKGIDFFIKIAHKMPQYKFVIIGINNEAINLLGNIPSNLELIGFLQQIELQEYYKKAKVYCQFSMVESFCLALTEAISFGAIGVVSNQGALPEIIGKSGYITDKNSINDILEKITLAIESETSKREESAKRILDDFNIEKRRDKIFEVFENYKI